MGCTSDIATIITDISSLSSHGGCWVANTYLTNPCIDPASLHTVNCGTFCAAPTFKANYTPSVDDVFGNATITAATFPMPFSGSGGDVCTGSTGDSSGSGNLHVGRMGMFMVIVSVAVGVVGRF